MQIIEKVKEIWNGFPLWGKIAAPIAAAVVLFIVWKKFGKKFRL